MTAESGRPVVAIVGGGFTGAAVAYHLARQREGLAGTPRIVVMEPRAEIGRGLAYDTADPAHRINVPAARMSILPDEPDHFERWLAENGLPDDDPDAATPDGRVFARRGLFGRYAHAQLSPLLSDGTVEHRRTRAASVTPMPGERWFVRLEDGSSLAADILVLATSHPAPQAPAGLDLVLSGHPRYVADATLPGALDAIGPDDRVLIVGTGLTAADVMATLSQEGHRGGIVAISRRGLRSRGHCVPMPEPFGDFADQPATTARQLLGRVRRTVADARAAGLSWHAVFDQLRGDGGAIWRSLPVKERRRLVRHLRPYWDVHRFRIAPQVEAVIDEGIATGRIRLLAASVFGVRRRGDDILVGLRHRRGVKVEEQRFDAVIVTTGPGHGAILRSQPFLAELAAHGFLTVDPVGLGLHVTGESLAIAADGRPSQSLYIAGPLARGTFGELMGLPQVTEHAIDVAGRIAGALQARRRGPLTLVPPLQKAL